MRRLLLVSAAVVATGCTLLVRTDDLATEPPESDAGKDVSAEATPDRTPDASEADAPPASTSFLDDFNRPNGRIGNDWIEKHEGFLIDGDRVKVTQSGLLYRASLVYRPVEEDLRDVEVSVTCTTPDLANTYPQIYARVQSSTISGADTVDGYGIVVADPVTAQIFRQHGNVDPDFPASGQISPPLEPGKPFRMRLRVTGTSPVVLAGFIESDGNVVGQVSFEDSSPKRIQNAGSVAFSADTGAGMTYDDFRRDAL